jgi:hypothetical protein
MVATMPKNKMYMKSTRKMNIHQEDSSFSFCGGGGWGWNSFIHVFSTCSQWCSSSLQRVAKTPHFVPFFCPKFSPSHQYRSAKGGIFYPHKEIVLLGSLPIEGFYYCCGLINMTYCHQKKQELEGNTFIEHEKRGEYCSTWTN